MINTMMENFLVWINNNSMIALLCSAGVVIAILFAPIFMVKIGVKRNFIIVGFFCAQLILLMYISMLLSNSNLKKALLGKYGQKWVETQQFEANVDPKTLVKLIKGLDWNDAFSDKEVSIWYDGKLYEHVTVEKKEGVENKNVFLYRKATVKGIQVNNDETYMYVYIKKPQQKNI